MTCGDPLELRNEILATIGFEATGDIALAKRFITAAEAYLALAPEEIEDQHNVTKFNFDYLSQKLRRAYDFIAFNDTENRAAARTKFFGMDNFRGGYDRGYVR